MTLARPRRRLPRLVFSGLAVAAALAISACSQPDPPTAAAPVITSADSGEAISGGAISAPQLAEPKPDQDSLQGTQWPQAALGEGKAHISCSADYNHDGDGAELAGLDYFQILDAMQPCHDTDLVRLHYAGKIDAGFVHLVQRVGEMAGRMGLSHRILDMDSAGGHVEQGIRAGDVMGSAGWTLWVRETAVCHSACVLILAAADNRLVSGQVGIHRMLRLGSQATTRAELNAELQDVHTQLADYLKRNGASTGVADLMMTVPSRDLRMLDTLELQNFGLLGVNAVQQDLERISMLRECGEDFTRRHETFTRRFERQCSIQQVDVDEKNACGRRLQRELGFPDSTCPQHTPMPEVDAMVAGRD